EERQGYRRGEDLAGGGDDLVQAGSGHPAAEIALLLAAADVVVRALIAVDGAERSDLPAAGPVEPLLPAALRRRLGRFLGRAGGRAARVVVSGRSGARSQRQGSRGAGTPGRRARASE